MSKVSLRSTPVRSPGFGPGALLHRLALGASLLMLSATAMSAVTVLSSNRVISASADGTVFDQAASAATNGFFSDQVQRSRFQDFGVSVDTRADQDGQLTNTRFEAAGQAQVFVQNPDGLTASAKSVFDVVFSVLTAQDFVASVSLDNFGGLGSQRLQGFLLENEDTGEDIIRFAASGDGSLSQTFSGLLQAGTYRLLALSDLASDLAINAQGQYRFQVDFSDAAPGNAVPLPGSAALAALGLALLGAQRRRAGPG